VAARELLASPEPPTAIFAASDNLALITLVALREHGYQVPQDVAVVGFDDIQMAAQTSPPLTTVRIPLIELGRRAADLVLELNEDANGAETVTLPLELIHRGTA
jgi:LacI family transcriptional regulator